MNCSFFTSFTRYRAATWAGLLAVFWALGVPSGAWAQSDSPLNAIDDQLAAVFSGLLIGVLVTAAAYLFFIWVVIRDKGQAFLLFFLLCLGANITSSSDLLMSQSGVYDPMAREFLGHSSLILSWVFGLFFSYYFLELDTNQPEFKNLFGILSTLLLTLVIYALINRTLAYLIMPAAGVLTVSAILVAGISGMRNGTNGSIIHMIAFTFFLGGILAEPSYILGLILSASTAHNITYVSFAMSAVMFAVVVANQFAARQDEKEKALAVSNERFMLATRGANEGLFDWNLANGEVFFSDQFRKILGVRIENTTAGLKKWIKLMQPTDRRIVNEALRRFRANPKTNTLNIEYRIIHMNGERRWLHSKAVAMRDRKTQKVLRLVGSTSDITARKQSETALRASETRFRSITEAHPVPVLIISLDSGTILYATPGAENLLGLTQDQLQSMNSHQLFIDADKRAALWHEITQDQRVDLMEMEIAPPYGQIIPAAISARRINYQNEDAMVIGLYDLTERKKAEMQIAQQEEALQQSEKMAALGGLLAGVAHELNNPLSVVVGQATLLMEGATEPKTVSRAEKIFKAADRCSRIVKSFLALARRKAPERKPVDLNQVVRSSLELLGYQLKTSDVNLDIQLSDTLPTISGDGDQLTQVITNLVLNAAQAMEGWTGQHHITINSHNNDDNVILQIIDTGPGVPADLRSRVFEPFFTTKSSKGGTGVGLALCLNIIASHGGELSLTDTLGGGATFTITLPSLKYDDQSAATPDGDENLAFGKIRLLLVDDEVEIAQTLADLMEPEGHSIDIAANGAIALEKLRKHPFDAIISDLRMPIMDGPALYEALQRELPSYANRIIYVTGDTLSTHVQEFLRNHTVPLVEKPYRLKDIHHALRDLLANAQRNAV